MGSSKKPKGNQHRGARARNRLQTEGHAGGVPLEEAGEARVAPLVNILCFVGYMASVWLIGQTVNSLSPQSGTVPAWSPALLGAVLAASTAILRDERGVRSRLGITDFSSRRASLIWGALGMLGIFSIMTLPR